MSQSIVTKIMRFYVKASKLGTPRTPIGNSQISIHPKSKFTTILCVSSFQTFRSEKLREMDDLRTNKLQ